MSRWKCWGSSLCSHTLLVVTCAKSVSFLKFCLKTKNPLYFSLVSFLFFIRCFLTQIIFSLSFQYHGVRKKEKKKPKSMLFFPKYTKIGGITQGRSFLTCFLWHFAHIRVNDLPYWNTWSKNWIVLNCQEKSCDTCFQACRLEPLLVLKLHNRDLNTQFSFYGQMKKHQKDKMNITPH